MKRHVLTIAVWLACLPLLPAQEAEKVADPKLWFPIGEELVFKAYMGIIPVGSSRATTQWIEEDGRKLLLVQFKSKSNNFLSKFYPVNDLIESVIDPVTFLPLRFTKRLSQGKYRCDETTYFDHEKRTATWTTKTKKRKPKTYPIESDTRDLVAFMYNMRRKPLKEGDKKTFQVMSDEKLYDLFVEAKEVEKVKLKNYGKVESLKVNPTAKFQGLFVRKGKMFAWVSEDARRIFTKIQIKIPVASVKLLLSEVKGPGKDFWITDNKNKDKD